MDKCGVTVPNSSSELLATLPLTGRGNTRAALRAPSFSVPIKPCHPLLPFSSPACRPEQGCLPARSLVIVLTGNTWSPQGHVLVPWDSRIPSLKQPESTDHQGRNETCSDCSRAKKPWARAVVFPEPSAHVWEEVAKATRLGCSPLKIDPLSFPQGHHTL